MKYCENNIEKCLDIYMNILVNLKVVCQLIIDYTNSI